MVARTPRLVVHAVPGGIFSAAGCLFVVSRFGMEAGSASCLFCWYDLAATLTRAPGCVCLDSVDGRCQVSSVKTLYNPRAPTPFL